MLEPFKLDSLYHLTINSEYIPLDPPTISKIINAIIVDFRVQYGLKEFDYIHLFKNVEWKWMGVRGNLTKRISKWYYEQYKAKLLQETSTAIGNIVRAMIVKNQDYHYDFTQHLSWDKGDFGDRDSCFCKGGMNERIPFEMMKNPRFYAVRFYREISKDGPIEEDMWGNEQKRFYTNDKFRYEGMSRAWPVKDEVSVKVGDKDTTSPFYIIFNGYAMSTKSIASILASSFGCAYQPVKASNNKGLHGGLYLNDDLSYIIGEEAVIKNIERYDFGLPYAQEDSIKKSQIIMKGSPELKDFEIKKPKPIPIHQWGMGAAEFLDHFGNLRPRDFGDFADAWQVIRAI